ncbi:hypothetical protein DFH29DRAFT_871795 [Suillus ampliporus]|nr:hypothetical protein DFH29DRAFT_871795 [Suillus ampliporus]
MSPLDGMIDGIPKAGPQASFFSTALLKQAIKVHQNFPATSFYRRNEILLGKQSLRGGQLRDGLGKRRTRIKLLALEWLWWSHSTWQIVRTRISFRLTSPTVASTSAPFLELPRNHPSITVAWSSRGMIHRILPPETHLGNIMCFKDLFEFIKMPTTFILVALPLGMNPPQSLNSNTEYEPLFSLIGTVQLTCAFFHEWNARSWPTGDGNGEKIIWCARGSLDTPFGRQTGEDDQSFGSNEPLSTNYTVGLSQMNLCILPSEAQARPFAYMVRCYRLEDHLSAIDISHLGSLIVTITREKGGLRTSSAWSTRPKHSPQKAKPPPPDRIENDDQKAILWRRNSREAVGDSERCQPITSKLYVQMPASPRMMGLTLITMTRETQTPSRPAKDHAD